MTPGMRLSICITTRNRAVYLRESISSILKQLLPGIEIVVLDAASEDGTKRMMTELAGTTPSLSYFRQEENGGIDRDYARAADLAKSEYVWFMSDDDLLVDGALGKVMEACGAGYSLIVANAEDWDADFSERLRGPRLPFPEDREYSSEQFVRLFEDVGHFLSFIPGVVVKKEIWSSRDREQYFGSFFAHLGVLFQAPLPGRIFVFSEPLVRIRNGNVSWSGRSFEIWMVRWPQLVWSLREIPEISRGKVSAREPWKHPAELVEYRAMGAYSLSEYRAWIRPQKPSILFRGLALALAIIPGTLVNFACIGYCLLSYRGMKFPLYNLKRSRYYFGRWLSNRGSS